MTYFPLYQTTCFFIPLVDPCTPLLAKQYNLVTPILREVGNMCVRFRDAEPDAQPCVSILFAHETFLPKLVEGPMCLHPLLPELFVGKRPHRQASRLVRLYISVAGGIR